MTAKTKVPVTQREGWVRAYEETGTGASKVRMGYQRQHYTWALLARVVEEGLEVLRCLSCGIVCSNPALFLPRDQNRRSWQFSRQVSCKE
jgi:hypothetical protein